MIALIKSGRPGRERVARVLYFNQELQQGMKNILLRYGAPSHDVEDIFHYTLIQFFKLVLKTESFTIHSNLNSYLYGIAKNVWFQKIRKNKNLLTSQLEDVDFVDDVQPVDLLMIEDEKRKVLHGILSNLGAKCKDVLLLWASGFKMSEIALKLGYSSDEVARRRKYVCMKLLVKYFDQNDHVREILR